MRTRLLVLIAVAVVVIAGLSFYTLRTETPPVAISPTPTAIPTIAPPASLTPTAAPTATTQPSASPTPRPTQTPVGLFVNADMGYAIELRQPWHRSTCGSSISGGPLVGTNGTDLFIPIPDADFQLGHIGPFGGNADTIHVFAVANPEGSSPRDFKRTRIGSSSTEQLTDTTFLGRPALLVQEGSNETFLFANAGYIWQVGQALRQGSTALADRSAIVRSFRFLTADEARAAAAAATPSPAPRTPEQAADLLAEGFAKRDVSTLARVIRPCFYEANYDSGPSSMIAQAYLDKLRQRFAQGLVVDVRSRPIGGDPSTTMRIRTTWREPGQPDRLADLQMTVHRGTTYWDGTVTCVFSCPP